MRAALLVIAFIFLLAFFAITLVAIRAEGLNVLSVLSIVIIALMGIGIFGALASGADRDE